MSFDAMEWVWEPVSLSPHERLTLMNLAWRLNQLTGRCYPSLGRIAADTGISERGVRYCLKSLEEKGHIRRVPRYVRDGVKGRNSNGYILTALTHIKSPYRKLDGGAGAVPAPDGASVAGADEADASAGAATAPKQGSNSGMEQGSNACPSAHGKAKSEGKQSPKHGGNEAGATVAVPHYIAPDPPCTAEEALAIINGLP